MRKRIRLLLILTLILVFGIKVDTQAAQWSDWSKWTTKKPSSAEDIQTKIQYRYADKEVTTSTSSSLSGWTQTGSSTSYGNWGAWSGWQTNAISKTDTRDVGTATVYGFYYFYCTNCGRNARYPYHGYACEICGKSGVVKESTGTVEWFTNTHASSTYWGSGNKYYQYITGAHGRGIYWNWDSGSARTGYRSRTRSKTVTYSYYKWGNWSAWSDSAQIATDSRKVETRVLYRTRHKHAYASKIVTKATMGKVGKLKYNCKKCDNSYTKSIPKISKVKLSTSQYTYNGKVRKPSVVVKDSKGNTIASKYYTVTYASGRKMIGKYKVTVKFKGRYSGTVKKYFKIMPRKMVLEEVSSPSKTRLDISWKKDTTVTGYEIQFSVNKNFSPKRKKLVGVNTTIKKIAGLSSNTTYYVRVRGYKNVNGTKYYGAWSKVKTVKVK